MIIKTPDTCGGSARIDGTRMTVWFLVSYPNNDEAILQSYPHINQAQLNEVWIYYEAHKKQIDIEIREKRYGNGYQNRFYS